MGAKVLIVDDSVMIRRQVGQALIGAGFAIVEAGDGTEALKKLAENPDVGLVVCDVNMPRMNGIEFLEQKNKEDAIRAVPVVMLTTEGQPDLIARAKGFGAKGWIVKPFKADLLVSAVKKLTASAA